MKMTDYKNPFCNQYVAPDGYCFYNEKGEKLGKIVWLNSVNGIYVDIDN